MKKKSASGVTLVELLIAIIVATIAAGLILSAYTLVVQVWNNYNRKIEASGTSWVEYIKIEHLISQAYSMKKTSSNQWVVYKDNLDSSVLMHKDKSLFFGDSSLPILSEIDSFHLDIVDTSGLFPVWECGVIYSQARKKSSMVWRTICGRIFRDRPSATCSKYACSNFVILGQKRKVNMSLPYIDSSNIDNSSIAGLPSILDYEAARAYRVVPVERQGFPELMLVTDSDLTDLKYNELRFLLKKEFCICKVAEQTFSVFAEKTWPDAKESFYSSRKTDDFKAKIIMDTQNKSTQAKSAFQVQEQAQPKASVIEIVDEIFSKAIGVGASDIHIEPNENEVKIRFRLDGVLQQIMSVPKTRQNEIISRLKILARLDIAEKRRPQDGRILVEGKAKAVDVRVSTMPTATGEKIVLRLLDKSAQPLDLKALGLHGNNYDAFCSAIRKPNGMILVTGPTGSGKTTTLYAAINEIQSPEINISTVEDPVEYQISGINQTQYNPDIQYTFAEAVKTFLRQDPDVIMIGEIRDPDTAKYAIQASQTGHLVFSTLHTNDAPGAVVRMLEMGMEPYLVASTLQLVIAQRLLRTTCKKCGDNRPLNERELFYAKRNGLKIEKVFGGKGCRDCLNTGYKGRVGIYEIMLVTPELQDLIALKTPTQKIREKAIEQGMKTLSQEAIRLVNDSKTTLEEVESSIG